jgi:DNA-binding beta-propeller fold protein YncE
MYSLRRYILWIVPALLCTACGGRVGSSVVPPPTSPPVPPPFIAGHGTLAVIDVADPKTKTVRLFRPDSDHEFATIITHGERYQPNSITFDHRGRLYVGVNDTNFPGKYTVTEFKVNGLERIREITDLPGWNGSSVVTDDQNYLYVNTKAFLGGDIKIYKPNADRKPYLEIKDTGNLITTLAAHDTLWVASEVVHGAFLDGYELRSRKSKFSHSIKGVESSKIAVNADGSWAAVFLRNLLSPEWAVNVFSAKTGFLRQIIKGKNLKAMAGDGASTIYVSESGPGRVFRCDFQHCPVYFATNSNNPAALAVNPRNRNLYIANRDAGNVQVYHPGQSHPFLTIAPGKFEPTGLAIEP